MVETTEERHQRLITEVSTLVKNGTPIKKDEHTRAIIEQMERRRLRILKQKQTHTENQEGELVSQKIF